MKYRLSFALLVASVCCLTSTLQLAVADDGKQSKEAATIPAVDWKGNWFGTLDIGGIKLRLGFVIEAGKEGKLSGKLFSIDQGNVEIAVDAIEAKGDKISLSSKMIFARFDGTWNATSSEIAGEWKQGLQKFPLSLKKVDALPNASRPQDPKKPYPYREEEVEFKNAKHDVTLKGTLTLPKGQGPFPAVVLISGSGPQDRNEELLNHRPFLVLADALTRQGIAVLRFDDRDFTNPKLAMQVTVEGMAEDVLSGVKFLQSRSEIASSKIGLLGHSEGGLVAPMLASREKEIAFIVLIAGPGISGDKILDLQSEFLLKQAGMNGDQLQKELKIARQMNQTIKNEPDNAKAIQKLDALFNESVDKKASEEQKKSTKTQFDLGVRIKTSPWFRFFLGYDPRPAITKVACPVLAVIGEKDFQVPAKENIPALESALKEGQNRDYTVKQLSGLNHLLQPCETGTLAEYATIETTIDPAALKLITDWVVDHSK